MAGQFLKSKKPRRRNNPEIKVKGRIYTCSELMELTGWDRKVILNRIYLFREGKMKKSGLFKRYNEHRERKRKKKTAYSDMISDIPSKRISLKDIQMTPEQIALSDIPSKRISLKDIQMTPEQIALSDIPSKRISLKDIQMTPEQIALQEKYYPLNSTPALRHSTMSYIITPQDFGGFIRKLRQEKGITLRGFAQKVGMSPAYLSKIERGDFKSPGEEKIRNIAKALDQDEDLILALFKRVVFDF